MLLRRVPACFALALAIAALSTTAWAQAPVAYRFSFPSASPRWMFVELSLRDVPAGPLELQLSRSSPGRYALHDFPRNVHDVQAIDASNRALTIAHPTPWAWTIASPPSSLTVRYRVSGDRIDGTWLAIDADHAHLNMPAALLWVRGSERRSATVRIQLPEGSTWRIATQLFPAGAPFTYSAPNLQYLLDSPVELSPFSLRTFTIEEGARSQRFELAVHHRDSEAEVTALARDVEAVARQARRVFGRFPVFDGGAYTFLTDVLPHASVDGMEHRNCAIITSSGSLANVRRALLVSVAHELFHAWNVERIRPRSLEPFDFERANVSAELWLAEGFTEYYGPLLVHRAGLATLEEFNRGLARTLARLRSSPSLASRTAEEVSRMAPLVDGAGSTDPSVRDGSYLSYYVWGQAIALALDLTLRERSESRVTLDHVMRALWERFGTSGEREPGYVLRPYTLADVREVLASVSGDRSFAEDFLRRYVQGHDVADYRRLLSLAGLLLQPTRTSRPGSFEYTLVTAESTGLSLTPAQQRFRTAWLGAQGF